MAFPYDSCRAIQLGVLPRHVDIAERMVLQHDNTKIQEGVRFVKVMLLDACFAEYNAKLREFNPSELDRQNA